MSQPTKAQVKTAQAIIDQLIDEHQHDDSCIDIEQVEITYWPTPDIDQSYEADIYVCKLTGEQIDHEQDI